MLPGALEFLESLVFRERRGAFPRGLPDKGPGLGLVEVLSPESAGVSVEEMVSLPLLHTLEDGLEIELLADLSKVEVDFPLAVSVG